MLNRLRDVFASLRSHEVHYPAAAGSAAGYWHGVTMISMATVTIGDDLIEVLPGGYPGAGEQIRELAVLELYRRRILSSGRAAELLMLERAEFIRYASRLGIPYIDLDDVELSRELEAPSTL